MDQTDDVLTWEQAGTDEPGDQNADTQLLPHGYWSLGPNGPTDWGVELIENDKDGAEVAAGGIHLGHFPTEAAAKQAADEYEQGGRQHLAAEGVLA